MWRGNKKIWNNWNLNLYPSESVNLLTSHVVYLALMLHMYGRF